VIAVRAGHVELVPRRREQLLPHARAEQQRRRRDEEQLAIPERADTCAQQLDRIALLVDVRIPLVDLFADGAAGGEASKIRRRLRRQRGEIAAVEDLSLDRVFGGATSGPRKLFSRGNPFPGSARRGAACSSCGRPSPSATRRGCRSDPDRCSSRCSSRRPCSVRPGRTCSRRPPGSSRRRARPGSSGGTARARSRISRLGARRRAQSAVLVGPLRDRQFRRRREDRIARRRGRVRSVASSSSRSRKSIIRRPPG
jgi:hypothetical protein